MLAALVLLFSCSAWLNAQSKKPVFVQLRDGTELRGELVAEDAAHLLIETPSLGTLSIRRSEVMALIHAPEGKGKPASWLPGRDAARNIFGPTTGYGPAKGRGYYQNYMLFVSQVQVGLTDFFSLGAGIELVSLLNDISELPSIALYPKFALPVVKDKFQIGLGAVVVHLADYGPSTFDFVTYYTALTYGPPDRFFSVGLGYTAIDGEHSASPVYILGGQYRFTRNFALVTESWLARGPARGSLISLGARIIGQRVSWDLGGIFVLDHSFFGSDIIPLPLIGFTVPF
jgi:hypothetical protein